MELLYLLVIFAVIVGGIWLKKPLYLSMAAGVVVAILLYGLPFSALGGILKAGVLGKATVNMVLSFYSITFLQRMLEKRGRLLQAEQAISVLFRSKSLSAMLTAFVVGMMPSVGAVLIAAPIVDRISQDRLTVDERCFVASYYRHLSEAFLPTYSHILLALQLSGLAPLTFVTAMLPMVLSLFVLGHLFYLRKLGKAEGAKKTAQEKQAAFKSLLRSTWSILLSVVLILLVHLPVYLVVGGVILLNTLVDRFTLDEIKPFFVKAFEAKLIFNTIVIMIFKEVLMYSQVLTKIPGYFLMLPIPTEILYALIMLTGTIIAGTQAMVAVLLPMAFLGIAPGEGLPLFVLLMSMSYIAAQISPTHICLSVVTEHYQTNLLALIKKTLPVVGSFALLAFSYFYLLRFITG